MQTLWRNETLNLETILDFIRYGYSRACAVDLFYGHGTDNPADDVRSLVLGSLHLPYDIDNEYLKSRLTNSEKTLLCDQLEKRIDERVPVPYLIRQANFCGMAFYVDRRVLIPRSPIAECIEQRFEPWINPDEVSRILDLCTGSGCIAIACCHAFPDAAVDAGDISPDALVVAEINSKRLGTENQLKLILSDCYENIPDEKYDIIVSNPPYVGNDELLSLPEEYHYEPTKALTAENNGLAIIERILAKAAQYLSKQGILVVEVGNSEEAVIEAWPKVPFTWLEFERGGTGVFLLTYDQIKMHF